MAGTDTCICGAEHECPALAGPYDERIAARDSEEPE